jgi:purine-cytosine permease-like protein
VALIVCLGDHGPGGGGRLRGGDAAASVITVVAAVLTVVVHGACRRPHPLVDRVGAAVRDGAQQVIGALVFLMTGFGPGWVNAAADYSRYLPRSASARGVFGWTTFGGRSGRWFC